MADPWFKFYPADWRQDPCLRMCSAAARGLWIELICLMHQSEPYGYLVVNGNVPTELQLAALTGIPESQLVELLSELEQQGVFSRDRKQRIYSRRLIRDDKRARNSRENGKKGGNIALSVNNGKLKENSVWDNPQDKPTVIPQEARSQNLEARAPPNPPHETDAEIARRLTQILGWARPPGREDLHILTGWIDAGIQTDTILAVGRRLADWAAGKGKGPMRSFASLDRAMRDEHAKAAKPLNDGEGLSMAEVDEMIKRMGLSHLLDQPKR